MQTEIQISDIKEINRFREDYSHVDDLALSIQRFGLIQPPVLDENNNLIDGGSRIRACQKLGWTSIPFVRKGSLTEDQIHEMELEANIKRKDFSWQERVLGIAHLHDIKSRKAALEGKNWIAEMSGEMLGISRAHVNNILKVAEYLRQDKDKSGIHLCEGVTDALKWILKKQVDDAVAEQARRTLTQLNSVIDENTLSEYDEPFSTETEIITSSPNSDREAARERYLSNPLNEPNDFDEYYNSRQAFKAKKELISLTGMLKNISCLDFMQERGDSWCDHIITDPPYAIDMDMLEQASSGIQNIDDVKDEHDVDENKDLLSRFIPLAYNSIRDGGFLIMWCDYMMWQSLYDQSIAAGFKVQRWPIVWNKLGSCKNGAAFVNFTKDTEIAIVCRKGKATLARTSATSVISANHDEWRDTLGHAFVKPYELWKFLIEHCTQPNQLLYEPFAGRGSGVLSSLRLGRRVIATELQTNHYNHLIENVKQHYVSALGPQTQFC